jgi:hypothetical protein
MPKNFPALVHTESGKLYKLEDTKGKNGKTTKTKMTVSNSKLQIDSESEEEIVTPPTKHRSTSSSKSEKSTKRAIVTVSSDSEDEVVVPAPKSKKTSSSGSKKQRSAPVEESEEEEVAPITPPKKVAKATKKASKKTQKRAPVESESETDSDEELSTPVKLRAARQEMLTEAEMKERTATELERKYRSNKQFCRWYEHEYMKAEVEQVPWKVASKLLTDAAAALSKYKGLKDAKFPDGSHLINAIPKLKESGEKNFAEAMAIVETLSPEDAELFWTEQIRNKDAKTFEELVTIKDYERKELIAEIEANFRRRQEEAEEMEQ